LGIRAAGALSPTVLEMLADFVERLREIEFFAPISAVPN
jgi:hypothetical protein